MAYRGDKVYTGDEKIVIGFDIGTTMSAASYSHLSKGAYPVVEMFPTLALYDGSRCVACGEEALNYDSADDHEQMAKWFKLHMHPASLKDWTVNIPPLPNGISIQRVYQDIMDYMLKNTQSHFEKKVVNGASIWRRNRNSMTFIFAIPNAWGHSQQQTLRQAAIDAGLFPSSKADSLVRFVTEGEASVHFVSVYGSMRHWLSVGSTFGVVDAGGSTTDSTLYTCTQVSLGIVLKEASMSECVQAAGVNVDDVLGQVLQARLANSRFGDKDNIKAMVEEFEKKTKRLFNGNTNKNVIKFGGSRDTDRNLGILKGQISLSKEEVLATFKPVSENIVNSIRRLISSKRPQYLLLVGGFGESPYLRSELSRIFGSQGIEVITVEQPTKKAAAEGAVVWYLRNMVKTRIARETYGTDVNCIYNQLRHNERSDQVYTAPDGLTRISGVFDPWVEKGTPVEDGFTYTVGYLTTWPKEAHSKPSLGVKEVQVYKWEADTIPLWVLQKNRSLMPGFHYICTVQADLSHLVPHGLAVEKGPKGKYWKLDYQIAVTLPIGGAQLQARLQWYEKGILKQGPATTILEFN
ncbi:hypothetical protein PIIN_04807 [Serendipita indica DSM 11827]|uniref:Uncharacterized protein n=1 Tax=Serendipita indica (strain DSM 11827) TaxID=1109443 RepID=G4THS9_SERID|nr:hypothetical protein PIIN_04807 [Serendipita indica DSM 11827]